MLSSKWWNNKASDIKLVYLYSTLTGLSLHNKKLYLLCRTNIKLVNKLDQIDFSKICSEVFLNLSEWQLLVYVPFALGTAVAQWLRCCATNRKVAGSIPAGVTGIYHWQKILPIALWCWVDSASNRNEYEEYFLEVKAAGAWRWQPYHHPGLL